MKNLKLFVFFSLSTVCITKAWSQNLFPIIENGKWGYINSKGKKVVDFRFDKAYPFSENVAAVFLEGIGWGYIDTLGETAIPAYYSYASNFSEGLASVRNYDGSWVFINKKGKSEITVGKEPLIVGDFHNGIAYLDYGTTCGYIKRDKGEKIKDFILIAGEVACDDFSHSFVYGKEKIKGFGYYDKDGKKLKSDVSYTADKRIYRKDGKFGFQDSLTYERFLSATYDFVYHQEGDSVVIVEDSARYKLYNLNTHKFIFGDISSVFIPHFFSPYEGKYNGLFTSGELIAAIVNKKFVYLNRDGIIIWTSK